MTIPRIISGETISDGQLVDFKEEHYKYLVKVNRLKAGEKFYCMDRSGSEFLCEALTLKDNLVTAYAYLLRGAGPPAADIDVYFGLLKGEKNELIIKAGTQLGLSCFNPLIMKRTIVKLDKEKREEKLERFKRIAEDTARTSFLSFIPRVNRIKHIREIAFPGDSLKLIFSEKKDIPLLKEFEPQIAAAPDIHVLFGPEGGIEDEETAALAEKGFRCVSLGERALKAEFAFIFAMSVIVYRRKGVF